MTAIQPPGRFGALKIVDDSVESFLEKPDGDGSWINGGFFILEPSAIETIEDDLTIWEREPLESLAKKLNSPPSGTAATGPWIRFATRSFSTNFGIRRRTVENLGGLISRLTPGTRHL